MASQMSYHNHAPAQDPATPLPPGTAAGSSFRTRYFQNVDPLPSPPRSDGQARPSDGSKKHWRDYMKGLSTSMRSLDVSSSREKPLPGLPHDDEIAQRCSPYRQTGTSAPPPPAGFPQRIGTYYAPPAPAFPYSSVPPRSAADAPAQYTTPPPAATYTDSVWDHRHSHPPASTYGQATPPHVYPASRPQTTASPLADHTTSYQVSPTPRATTVHATPSRPKTFQPSFHPLSPPPITHAHSAPPTSGKASGSGKGSSRDDPIVLHEHPSTITPRRRVNSAVTSDSATVTTPQQRIDRSKASPSPSPSPGGGQAQRCAGMTRQGLPCKRLVKVVAPWLERELASPDESVTQMEARYCKDHAGQICSAEGFYRGSTWVCFDDWIPRELGQQTQALLRMTMESALTAGESPGFIYAYELRDLATNEMTFFKVGRTDNVPRRIGQWTAQCSSHTPTLRDIFPLSSDHSLLPGATTGGTSGRPTSKAVKRLERLIHLELADRSPVTRLLEPCSDCGTVHKEIFPLSNSRHGARTYEQVVKDVVCRWERYIAATCQDTH